MKSNGGPYKLLEEEKSGEYDFPRNQVRVLDLRKFIYITAW
jgi:hypothetical protein